MSDKLGEASCHAEGIRTQLLRKRISIYNQTKTLIDYGSKQNRHDRAFCHRYHFGCLHDRSNNQFINNDKISWSVYHKLKHWNVHRGYLSYCTLVHFADFKCIHFIHFLSAKVNQVRCNETSSIKSTRTLTGIGIPHVF